MSQISRDTSNAVTEQHNQNIVQLPAGFAAMETQVAGHTFDTSIGLLQDGRGCVLKPLGKPECGERELAFYEKLQLSDNGESKADLNSSCLLRQLRNFVPKYHEKVKLLVNNRQHTFMKMEDLTHGMHKPCIMDIKIGKRTWDPLATAEKRRIEEQKYIRCKEVLGLCVPGLQVYTTVNQSNPIRYSKEYGKNLDADGFRTTIALFINAQDGKVCKVLVNEILKQLYKIRDWFRVQRLFHFYSSSLLIVYDFVKLEENLRGENPAHSKICETVRCPEGNGICTVIQNFISTHSVEQNKEQIPTFDHTKSEIAQWVKVKMIDFAHVFPAEQQSQDANYIFGLDSLIMVFEELLRRKY